MLNMGVSKTDDEVAFRSRIDGFTGNSYTKVKTAPDYYGKPIMSPEFIQEM